MALFTSLMLVAFGVGNQTITPTIGALRAEPGGVFIFATFGFAAWATFSVFWYLFPSGHFVPKWTRVSRAAVAAGLHSLELRRRHALRHHELAGRRSSIR